MLLIDQKIFRRAKKGIRNCPFNQFLFTSLQKDVPASLNYFVPTPKASHHSIPQHLQQPPYYIAATSLSTTLQKLWKSPKITKNTKKHQISPI